MQHSPWRDKEVLSSWGDCEPILDEDSAEDCSASSSRRRASSLVILAWRSCVLLVRFFS